MKHEKSIRVAIASDQAIYRRGLVSLIMSLGHTQLVGEAKDGAEATQLCEMVAPDVLLLDLKSLSEGGKELVRDIHLRHPAIKTVFMLNSQEENQGPEEVEVGDIFYFSKDISEEEFSTAIQDIYDGLRAEPQEAVPASSSPSGPSQTLDWAEAAVASAAAEKAAAASKPETSDQARIRELKMAGRIQADIMPENVPAIQGWDIAARLLAARETSGDFFDFIPLDPQHWGIVVGDVTDKGIGAALFMALTSTLIRTYAVRYPTLPALTMDVVNQRMLSDTRGSMFVTAFYGVLEPKLGRLRFVNAGHPPGLMVSQRGAKPVDLLKPTGMALGLVEKAHWRQKVIKFAIGDTLLLYTDGITEAQNTDGDFYGEQQFMKVARASAGKPSRQLLKDILEDLHYFVGDQPQHDDIALIAIRKT